MPFDSLSTDEGDAYLADGITCEVTSALGRAGCLRIAPRADCFALRGKSLTLSELGAQLSVRYVVTGSVRRTGHKLRIVVEFADAETGQLLWSKTYDRESLGSFVGLAQCIKLHLSLRS